MIANNRYPTAAEILRWGKRIIEYRSVGKVKTRPLAYGTTVLLNGRKCDKAISGFSVFGLGWILCYATNKKSAVIIDRLAKRPVREIRFGRIDWTGYQFL